MNIAPGDPGRTVSLFLNDLTNYEVAYELEGEQQMVRGLPLMRPGEFNGREYSAADLEQMASNFTRLQDELGWVPGLKPRHTYDLRGLPENVDAREVMAWFDNLHFDDEEQVLFGDVQVVEDSMVTDMEKLQLRYLSTEVASDYVMGEGDDAEKIGPALVGCAWVDDPAIKGLPWELVMNAAEYSHLRGRVHTLQLGDLSASELHEKLNAAVADMARYAGDDYGPYVSDVFDGYLIVSHDGSYYRHEYGVDGVEVEVEAERTEVKQTWEEIVAANRQKGVRPMTGWEKFRNGLVAVFKGEAEPDSLLEAEEPEGGEDVEPVAADADIDTSGAETPTDAEPAGGDTDQLARQLAQERKAREELTDEVATMRLDRRRDRAEGLVDDLVREGHVPPPQRQRAYLLLDTLLASDEKVTVLVNAGDAEDEEREEAEQAVVQVLLDLLKGSGPSAVRQGPRGLVWQGAEDPGEASDAETSAVASEMAGMANEPESE